MARIHAPTRAAVNPRPSIFRQHQILKGPEHLHRIGPGHADLDGILEIEIFEENFRFGRSVTRRAMQIDTEF
jgi:hypothetical protein